MKQVIYMNQIDIKHFKLLTKYGFIISLRGWGKVDPDAAVGLYIRVTNSYYSDL